MSKRCVGLLFRPASERRHPMARKSARGWTRRDFVKTVGAGALAAGVASAVPRRAHAQQKTLRIAQWSHFVPEYDKWFDNEYTKAWGGKNNTQVVVDHINVNEIPARAAAEVAAKQGHDLFLFMSPPAAFEPQVLDMTHVYQEVERKHGKKLDLAHKSTFNPKTKKYFAFSDSYVPDPGNYRKDLWADAGFPNGPDTWDDLRIGAKKIRAKAGNPCGIGLSQELDTSMALRALMWSFGAAEQDEAGKVTINSKQTIEALKYMKALFQESMTLEVFTWDPSANNRAMLAGKVTINSKQTIEALKYMKALFQESMTLEVFTWDPSANNRAMLAGKVSFVQNAISVTRQAEREHQPISSKIGLSKALKGPIRRM